MLSLDELRAWGLSRDGVAARVENGRLHALHRGVYAVGHSNVALQGRFLGAVKACGSRAALSHFAAGALHGFVDWDGRYPEVTVMARATRRHPGIRVHRTSMLETIDLTWRSGIPVTSPARTLADMAAATDYLRLRRAVRQALSLKLVTLEQLVEVLQRLGGRRGMRKLARIIATAAPTRSVLEDVVLDLILAAGFAHPDVNVALTLAGRRVVPDFRWPEQRLVVEADSRAWHDHKVAREDDAERQALLEAHGERVVRVTWEQAVARPGQTIARLRAAGVPLAVECRVVPARVH